MSLQWTLIATFLYAEIAVVLLLVLPIASPQRWQRFFKSRFLQSLSAQASMYFLVLLAILVLFLLDAIREIRKYSSHEVTEHAHSHLDTEMQGNMRLFRAQRNFYISGFALFLSLVIRRLVTLISAQATLIAQSEASMKQAQSATSAARNLLQKSGESAQNDTNEVHDKAVTELKAKLKELESELEKEKKDKAAVKSQAESLAKEYDRLNEEHSKLLSAGGDKKSD
ncbi:B-cell receptor-associated protein 31 [Nasonia vitripennis]|uniref:Endoplasmic reticulum transmembrane protein n=2 Tax=Pteromalinae TaxID=272242 RepID=K7J2I9_NASVI|nr:B-cell receptor-associated protein 31 [Nasonia vitripennis]XP_008206250.1 B-cell receptor-associated protein 31 [Nasonia vitripennis]XP_032454153.1 B-cell receptor-associated protein 31 [Nasonia vitripennis]XP_032454154.1 B-cell receptor-associated protein 31 [Nasonia vitripennis]XP_032454156.1 B-cell receptor-associated protein 31 [Nasonia vitripennis]XP_032454157.1 B-cell receptor-associated protein 31 [Nasonia vitripennis]XP_032454158.1 B-cell receptor-associated protein 31 [Nasonia vit